MVGRRLHPNIRIRFYRFHSRYGRMDELCVELYFFDGFSKISLIFVFVGVIQVRLFRCTVLIFGDDCCFGACETFRLCWCGSG
jgi:hypothetical protein